MAFFEFNIGVSGLFAAQRGLAVTSNNISNANTVGYSRQVLEQQASRPLTGIGVGMVGTGVDTTGVMRMHNSYLDNKLWNQNDKLGEYRVKVEQSALVEAVFGEPSETGFTKVYNDLFKAFDDLSKFPDENERKVALRQQMINYTKYYNNIAKSLSNYQQDLNYNVKAAVDEINLLGSKIQSLNAQIYQAEIFGNDTNTFKDEREVCIDRLSQIINVDTKEQEVEVDDKKFTQLTVKIAGQTLVDHLDMRELGIEVRGNKEIQLNNLATDIDTLNKKIQDLGKTQVDVENELNTLKGEMTALEAILAAAVAGGDPGAIAAAQADVDAKAQEVKDSEKELKLFQEREVKATAMQKLDSQVSVTKGNLYEVSYNDNGTARLLVDIANPGMNTGYKLELKKLNEQDVDGLYDVVWRDGIPFNMRDNTMSGELKGIIDIRDGCGVIDNTKGVTYNGIPYYIKRMDNFVREFARTLNETYSMDQEGYVQVKDFTDAVTGTTVKYVKRDEYGKLTYYDEDKNLLPAGTKEEEKEREKSVKTLYQLFTYSTGSTTGAPDQNATLENNYKNMTAANFSISYAIYESINNIRTNTEHIPNKDTSQVVNPNPSNNDLLAALSGQKDNKKMFKEGDPKDYMVSMFSELGINAQEAEMYYKTQTSITQTIDNQRLSVSQVDMNDEFTNLIKYQQAYQVSAKLINTIDSIYETTIFKLGNF
ncbi:flagellar hook-associated protein FlgK [Sporanaerobium hydrogeniformans]|uniref:Flagellar hook-associated protein FlgK n=1 Tax=Sporanaerobium hydrogeniformans TaxID=3072179 RepID=A0AC61D8X0_9FIRM|nr:flagellar hook-associated protein FlgK [Sporanaerobium hydrogeniformans]PHV69834.1 flagellar hook-associated protein FlgK [Sporanaerobium hydrogeniformans]